MHLLNLSVLQGVTSGARAHHSWCQLVCPRVAGLQAVPSGGCPILKQCAAVGRHIEIARGRRHIDFDYSAHPSFDFASRSGILSHSMHNLIQSKESSVRIEIQPYNGTPIYRQISNQIRCLIASGQLKTGQERPVVRTLAEQLTVTPNTIVKAYDELGVAI